MLAVTDATRQAQRLLRDPTQFKWYVVALLAYVFYVYAVEVERRRWDIVLAGIAFWLMDWINEVANALVLHFTDRAPVWSVTGSTAYLILIGLTIEISFLFLVAGVVFVKMLPADRRLRILGLPNRLVLAFGFSLLCTGVELLLHETGTFHWTYWWWNVPFIPLIVLIGYLPFFLVAAWVYDMPDNRRRVRVVATLAAFDAALLILFGPVLGWI